MNRRTLGATLISGMVAVASLVALGAGGYMTMTGKTLCSLAGACGEKSEKQVSTVASKEGCAKSCSEANTVAASSKEGCAKSCSEAKTVAASSKEGCAKSCSEAKTVAAASKEGCAKSCSEAKTEQVAAKEGKSCCALSKTKQVAAASSGCSAAKTEQVAAKEGSCSKPCSKESFVMVKGPFPVVMPAMFFNAEAKVCPSSLKEVSSCNTPCKGEGKVEAVAAKSGSGCCQGKTASVQAAASKEAPAGCCKGTGVRADGKPCQKDGAHCDNGEKAVEAEKTEKKTEPVASR